MLKDGLQALKQVHKFKAVFVSVEKRQLFEKVKRFYNIWAEESHGLRRLGDKFNTKFVRYFFVSEIK